MGDVRISEQLPKQRGAPTNIPTALVGQVGVQVWKQCLEPGRVLGAPASGKCRKRAAPPGARAGFGANGAVREVLVRRAHGGAVQGLPSLARFRREFAAPALQGSRPLGVVRGGREALLTMRDVAAQLGVCAATVYRLVAEGQLAHVGVLNAIRVAPRDLETFVEARRRLEGGRG